MAPDPLTELRRDYTPKFLSYLTHQDENGLSAAYELGRQSMHKNIGLLDLVRVHSEVYVHVMSTVRSLEEAQHLARAASTFLCEALACFEMTQRGFMAGDVLEGSGRDRDLQP